MAIRINSNAALSPQYGRLTAPRGTFLSNPSTAADGALGGGQGMNPSFPTPLGQQTNYGSVAPGYLDQVKNKNLWDIVSTPFQQAGNALNNLDTALRGVRLWQPVAPQQFGPLASVTQLGVDLMGISNQMTGNQQFASPYSAPVEQPVSATQKPYAGNNAQITFPNQIPNAQAQLGMPGLSQEQINEAMTQRGYIKSYQSGVGEVWVRTGNSAPLDQLAQNANKQYQAMTNPAGLAPGETVVTDNAVYRGGTPTATGEGQYSVTYKNTNAANDKHGKYKWVSDVRKDANGNWVRVNRQVLRKVYTRSHFHGGRGGGLPTGNQPGNQASGDQAQLVNFRANFG